MGELERDLDLVLKRLFEMYGFELLSSLDLDLERLFAPPFTFDLERTFPSFLLLDTEGDTERDADLIFRGDLECLLLLVFEVSLALYLGDTEREADLKSLLLLVFEVSLALYLGDTEREADLKSLSHLIFEVSLAL